MSALVTCLQHHNNDHHYNCVGGVWDTHSDPFTDMTWCIGSLRGSQLNDDGVHVFGMQSVRS